MKGITRREAFIKILSILEECDLITYKATGFFTKNNLIEALSQTEYNTGKALGYTHANNFNRAIKDCISKDIFIAKKIITVSGNWDKYLLYLINYRYCPKCKLCYRLNSFSVKNKDPYGKEIYCKICRNTITSNMRNDSKNHIIDIMKKDNIKIECISCGYNKNWAAIDLHHIDSSIQRPIWSFDKNGKTKSPSQYILQVSKSLAEERYIVEKDNLQLLCSNCHREIHNPIKEENI